MQRHQGRIAAACAVVAAVATGCGGGEGDGAADGRATATATATASASASARAQPSGSVAAPAAPTPSASAPAAPSPSASAPTGRPLTRAQLDAAALATGDVDGWTVAPPDPDLADGAGEERADEPACEPLAALLSGVPTPKPRTLVYRQLAPAGDNAGGEVVTVYLAAYAPDAAATVLGRIDKALGECAKGFTTTAPAGPSAYTAAERLPAPRAGDQAIALRLTGDLEGDAYPMVFEVVRNGTTVAVLYGMNLTEPARSAVPEGASAAQAEKLRRAG
ncbi:hypothetical protein [Streptomyces sp. NPDC060194]|uniref:hypothetical protein n=1 Tax=Streptomyces sp. NPDC060194 TaxID=3347069 RepID=UPI003662C795